MRERKRRKEGGGSRRGRSRGGVGGGCGSVTKCSPSVKLLLLSHKFKVEGRRVRGGDGR